MIAVGGKKSQRKAINFRVTKGSPRCDGVKRFLLAYCTNPTPFARDPTQLEVGATLLDPPPTNFLLYDSERLPISLFAALRSPGWLALMSRSACPRRPVPSTSSARNFARNGSTYMAKRGEIGDFGDSGLLASRVPRRQPNWVVRGCCCVRACIYLSIYLSI